VIGFTMSSHELRADLGYRIAMRAAWSALVAIGCGTQSSSLYLLDTEDCAVTNNFKIDNVTAPWTDCRVFWSGLPYQTLTIELTIPNTTGSFLSPGAGWLRASLHAPGEVDSELATIPFEPSDRLPTSVAEGKIMFDLPHNDCGNIGTTAFNVRTMADVGDESMSLSLSMSGTCTFPGGQHAFSGGVIVTAAQHNTPPSVEVGTLVTPDE
jgi:hypothetical protein